MSDLAAFEEKALKRGVIMFSIITIDGQIFTDQTSFAMCNIEPGKPVFCRN